jgi:diguanylate cyclase (GGDEF)-like protein
MVDVSELLRPYLLQLSKATNACAISVFLPASVGGSARGRLLHLGEGPAVPELADLDAAVAFATRCRVPNEAIPGQRRRGQPGFGAVESSIPDGVLLPIPPPAALWYRSGQGDAAGVDGPPQPAERADDRDSSMGGIGWIGLRLESAGRQTISVLQDPRSDRSAAEALGQLLDVARALAAYFVGVYGIVADPVTGLPGRAALQVTIADEIEESRVSKRPFSLLLINPHDFGAVNAQLGCHAGDTVLRDVVVRLLSAVRTSDPVMRYGAAVFAVILRRADSDAALRVAHNIRYALSSARFLDDAVQLTFSVGIAMMDPGADGVEDALALVQRADLALASAREASEGRVQVWSPALQRPNGRGIDRLGALFTGRMDKDYRNMGLLWDVLGTVTVNGKPDELATRVVEKLFAVFAPERVALLEKTQNGTFRLQIGLRRSADAAGSSEELTENALTPGDQDLLARATKEGRAVSALIDPSDVAGGRPLLGHVIPLFVGDDAVSALYLVGRQGDRGFDSSDLTFLSAFGAQMAIALDRARLAEQEHDRREQERRQLRAELHDLRSAVRQAKLLYQSHAMEHVVTTARRIAATDTTVLVTGESGTGKERLAHTIHELSDRKSKPFIIVDCGSIPQTLIESELFGHEKGSFTGAGERSIGRLAQADRGTVVLDEVGELPLEVQAKLLRFVQEKHFTPVGSTRPRQVDARIIAVTNRDLEREVAAGRFREDLFYRLNVVRLRVPPLRERRDDVLFLARHFIETFSLQYAKHVKFISTDAEESMIRYSWPGNVRELQNRILQAVILTGGDTIDGSVLGIDPHEPRESARPFQDDRVQLTNGPRAVHGTAPAQSSPHDPTRSVQTRSAASGNVAGSEGSPWDRIRRALAREVEAALKPSGVTAPLGKWLGHEAVLVGYELSGSVMVRAAALLGLPETTFARKYQKAVNEVALSRRSETWPEVRDALVALLRDPARPSGDNVLDRLDGFLLDEVAAQSPRDAHVASQLLGISLPTFRRRVATLPLAS